ncbi:tRNA lysidine(34) synthetase TilS [Bacillus sp. A116_S68]|nr:tRNA lysidine(34) synthetase TilS [Bacillus sp. A116_S68]
MVKQVKHILQESKVMTWKRQ